MRLRVRMTREQKDIMMTVFADNSWTFMEVIDNSTDPDCYDLECPLIMDVIFWIQLHIVDIFFRRMQIYIEEYLK